MSSPNAHTTRTMTGTGATPAQQPMTRGTATGVKRKVLMAGGALAMAATTSMMGAQPANATLCSPRVYSIVWDGWQGTLNLCSQNGDGSWLQQGTTRHKVTYREGRQQTGYDHRIRFNVDFAGTPANASDDQPFDGYFLTRQPAQRRGLAGITYWQGIPFGFYAARVR